MELSALRPAAHQREPSGAHSFDLIHYRLTISRWLTPMRVSLSIRTYLTALVVGSVLPFVVFSGLLVYRSAADEQELIAQTVRNAAQNVATDLNRQIGGLQSLALALADSRLLQTGDLSAFQAQAIDLVQRQGLAAIL
jgi:hypothetical protein